MKKVVLVFVLVGIAWIAWPYYAVYDFMTAVQNGDQEALERRIDWPSLRQGLRDDFNSIFMRKVAADAQRKRDEQGAAFGAGLAALMGPAIIDRAIDAYVTPSGIAALIKNGRPAPASQGLSTSDHPAPTASSGAGDFKFDRVKYAFFSHSPMTFRIEVAPPEGATTKDSAVLLFKWDGDWRLSRIFLPKDVMESP